MKWKRVFALTSTWCIFSFAALSFGAEDQVQKREPAAPPSVSYETEAKTVTAETAVPGGMEYKSEGGSPSAFIPMNKFEFEPVIEGAEVIHDFIVQNKGTGVLNIDKVKTG